MYISTQILYCWCICLGKVCDHTKYKQHLRAACTLARRVTLQLLTADCMFNHWLTCMQHAHLDSKHRQTDRQTDRQAGRQTDRQTHTHTHTHRQTDRHTQADRQIGRAFEWQQGDSSGVTCMACWNMMSLKTSSMSSLVGPSSLLSSNSTTGLQHSTNHSGWWHQRRRK
jgi:ABC-type nickel/cobalt efflux system permease component RcnA